MRPASKAEGKTGGVDPLLLQEKAHSLGQSPLSMGYRPFKASIFEARFRSSLPVRQAAGEVFAHRCCPPRRPRTQTTLSGRWARTGLGFDPRAGANHMGRFSSERRRASRNFHARAGRAARRSQVATVRASPGRLRVRRSPGRSHAARGRTGRRLSLDGRSRLPI
jgi:hypothetical protein